MQHNGHFIARASSIREAIRIAEEALYRSQSRHSNDHFKRKQSVIENTRVLAILTSVLKLRYTHDRQVKA